MRSEPVVTADPFTFEPPTEPGDYLFYGWPRGFNCGNLTAPRWEVVRAGVWANGRLGVIGKEVYSAPGMIGAWILLPLFGIVGIEVVNETGIEAAARALPGIIGSWRSHTTEAELAKNLGKCFSEADVKRVIDRGLFLGTIEWAWGTRTLLKVP